MAYKVFISHSTRDWGLVASLAKFLSIFGVQVFVAEWSLTPDEQINKKVFNRIKSADCMVALLTRNGTRVDWLQQEIMYALRTDKPIIPLVEKGINPEHLEKLQFKDYIEYDPYQPQQALVKTSGYVNSLKLKKKEQEKMLLVAGGIIAFLILLSGGEN